MTRKYSIQHVAPVDLLIDPEVQRREDPRIVTRLLSDWNRGKLGMLDVSKRPDGLYVFNGQHRRSALILRGEGTTKVPCVVWENLNREEEAEKWLIANVTRRPQPLDIFRLRLAAGHDDAIEISKIFADLGLSLGGDVVAVSAVEAAHAKGNLGPTLQVLGGAWDEGAFEAVLIRGVSLLLSRYQVDTDRLVKMLAKSGTAGRLIGHAKTMAEATRSSQADGVVDVAKRIYNTNLASANRLD